MGIRNKNNKQNNNSEINYYKTMLDIKRARICEKCPLKLYADRNAKIILGTGNIMTDTMMILPSYDINNKLGYYTILDILKDEYNKITGLNILEECYVTRSIKCVNKTDFNIEDTAIEHCVTNLYYEISKIVPKTIIIFDKRLYGFVKDIKHKIKLNIKTVISPGVMYYDNTELKSKFIQQLTEAIND